MAVGNGRRRKTALDPRERRFAQGVARGKTKVQAARDAGYTESTALKKSFALIDRPRIRSFLTDALEQAGLTPDHIVQAAIEALNANHILKSMEDRKVYESDVPDHDARMRAMDRLVDLYGGTPRDVDPKVPPPSTLETAATDLLLTLRDALQAKIAAKALPPV